MSTIDIKEIHQFDQLANEWWDTSGQYKILHTINPLRIGYIKEQILAQPKWRNHNALKPFKEIELLDIGCGGGLISVPMANLGANVTGVDASGENIKVAKNYAHKNKLNIKYVHSTAEKIATQKTRYDVILALEIIEHVADYQLFLHSLKKLLKPQGLLFISTINRNMKSLLLAKIAAEYVLNWVPAGTHSWDKFLQPQEIETELKKLDLSIIDSMGLNFSLLRNEWYLSDDTSVNYTLVCKNIIK
jgi:2-polyprenyl-6-hydroxyphenyl methylase / 3-demethylubiquinone-9 3-methyltransferase